MSNPLAGGSKALTVQKTPSGSTDTGQVNIKLPVLRICTNGSYEFIKIKSTTDGIINLPTGDVDLGHVPDVRDYWPHNSSWDQYICTQTKLDSQAHGGELAGRRSCVPGTYYMMICKLEKLGQHDTAWVSLAKVHVWGDVFIFKVTENSRDVHGRAMYEQVPAEIMTCGIAQPMLQNLVTAWEDGERRREASEQKHEESVE